MIAQSPGNPHDRPSNWCPEAPRVSVIITAYNDLRFIEAAVKSVLAQTYTNFELIVVDDGTGQNEIFDTLAKLDARVHIITCDRNMGTYAAANRGIAVARGEIIARLDADDIAEPARLDHLVAALDADPELGLVGSWARHISESDELLGVWQAPVADLEARWTALFQNPFCHSSVAFRRTCFDLVGGYSSTMRQSGDYELWWKMLEVCRVENIPETLTQYRSNSRGLSAGNPANWRQRTDPIRRQSWERLGVEYEPELVPHLLAFLSGLNISDRDIRERTYRTALLLLAGLLAATRSKQRETDDAVARKLKAAIVGRILADRSNQLLYLLRLWPLCWRLDRSIALTLPVKLITHVLSSRATS
jgi:glycosyltransferase involved in cell wall biosynthesis